MFAFFLLIFFVSFYSTLTSQLSLSVLLFYFTFQCFLDLFCLLFANSLGVFAVKDARAYMQVCAIYQYERMDLM